MNVVLVLAVIALFLLPVTVVAGLADAYHLVSLLRVMRSTTVITARAVRSVYRTALTAASPSTVRRGGLGVPTSPPSSRRQ